MYEHWNLNNHTISSIINFRTVVDLANSLGTYVQSEGRRPDLKVIEDIQKPLTSPPVDVADNKAMGSHDVPNMLYTDRKPNVTEGSIVIKGNGDNDANLSDANSSDSSDLDETLLVQHQKVKMRPAFNCKKRLISHSKYWKGCVEIDTFKDVLYYMQREMKFYFEDVKLCSLEIIIFINTLLVNFIAINQNS